MARGEGKSTGAARTRLNPEESEGSTESKKRGRSPTTGKGFLIREKKAAKQALEELKRQADNIREIVDIKHDPRDFRPGSSLEVEETERTRNRPSRDIVADLNEAALAIIKVATTSGNLKGGYIKTLKEAALKVRVGTDALATRAMSFLPPPKIEKGRRRWSN